MFPHRHGKYHNRGLQGWTVGEYVSYVQGLMPMFRSHYGDHLLGE